MTTQQPSPTQAMQETFLRYGFVSEDVLKVWRQIAESNSASFNGIEVRELFQHIDALRAQLAEARREIEVLSNMPECSRDDCPLMLNVGEPEE